MLLILSSEQRRMANALCASLCPDPHFPTHHPTPNTSQRADTHTHARLMTLNTHQKLFYFLRVHGRCGAAYHFFNTFFTLPYLLLIGPGGASPRRHTASRCAPFHHSNLIKLSFKFNEKNEIVPPTLSWIRAYIFGVAKGRCVGAICISRLD